MRRLGNYSWVFKIKPDSVLSVVDLIPIFGVSSATSVRKAIRRGSIPKPDFTVVGHNYLRKNQWYAGTIQKLIQENLTGQFPEAVVGETVAGKDDAHADVAPKKLLNRNRRVNKADKDD